ncbi:MAG: hypothetical protein IJZ08_09930 [Clostridia bacterium]|nr:hypothetical protein [Clostridia bacterium]
MRKLFAWVLSVSTVCGTLFSLVSCSPDGGVLKIGTTAHLTGDFTPWWTDSMGDREVASLIEGYSTVVADKDGNFVMNPQIVTDLAETANEDGTRTYTLTFADDLRFSDGTPMTAEHFAAWVLLFSAPVILAVGGSGTAGIHFDGWQAYLSGEADTFTGVRLLSENRLSLTVTAEDSVNYYGLYNILLEPLAVHEWLPEGITVADDGTGVYFSGDFTVEACAEMIESARWDTTDRVTAGPFRLAEFDTERREAILERNEYFKGTYDGTKPTLDRIVYREVNTASMFAELQNGDLDVLHGITGVSAINDAFSMENTGDYKTIRYDSDGCDALLFRCDYGPTQYADVRRGIAYLLDREELTESRFNDYAETVDAPYGPVLKIYDFIDDYADVKLDSYEKSAELAVGSFIRAGFVLGEDGQPYVSGIRYKEVTAEEAKSAPRSIYTDGKYLMPLIIDYCTYDGSMLSLFLRAMITDTPETEKTGISFARTELPYEEYLAYVYRDGSQGETYLTPKYCMFDVFYSFGTVYDVRMLYAGYPIAWENLSGIRDSSLEEAAFSLAAGIPSGNDNRYREKFAQFCTVHNQLLPELPLYAAVTVDVFSTKVNGYDAGAMKNIAQSVLKCSVGK